MENIYRKIVEGAPEAILFVDHQGIIRLWNHGAEKMFGYLEHEAVGQNLDLIIPERYLKRHRDGYFNVMQTGETHYGDELLAVPTTRKDGTRISLEFSISLLRNNKGRVIGATAIIRDVTARWEKERLRHK